MVAVLLTLVVIAGIALVNALLYRSISSNNNEGNRVIDEYVSEYDLDVCYTK